MVRITTQPPSVSSASPRVKRTREVEPVQSTQSNRHSNVPVEKPFVERRKNNDRRRYCAARGPFDLRCGRDRRKSLRKGQLIEVEA